MKVEGEYYRDGYAFVETLVPQPVAHELLTQIKTSLDDSELPLTGFMREGMMLKRPALELYSQQHKGMQAFLWGLTPTIGELTRRELLPTYCYFRVYREGDVCWVHSDRYACEHSISLTLAYSDDKTWPFEIGRNRIRQNDPVETTFKDDPYSTIQMKPGDAVLYQGVFYRHGRVTPNPNRWSAHLFMHWVDANGPFRDQAFDNKASKTQIDFELA